MFQVHAGYARAIGRLVIRGKLLPERLAVAGYQSCENAGHGRRGTVRAG